MIISEVLSREALRADAQTGKNEVGVSVCTKTECNILNRFI